MISSRDALFKTTLESGLDAWSKAYVATVFKLGQSASNVIFPLKLRNVLYSIDCRNSSFPAMVTVESGLDAARKALPPNSFKLGHSAVKVILPLKL